MHALIKARGYCLAWAILGMASGGCANLDVRKVPVAERAAKCDREEGFRYYLNRPYVVVKNPILIAENRSLVRVDVMAGTAPPQAKDKKPVDKSSLGNVPADQVMVTFLSGPRSGDKVRLADLKIETPCTGAVRQMSLAELQRIKTVLAADNGASVEEEDGNGAMATTGGSGNQTNTGNTPGTNSTSGSAEVQEPTLAAVQHTPPLTGDIAILYLPDLDEQYVIKSRNCLSKSAFGLAIRNGSELVEVQGEHDSTAVPLAIMTQIQSAIAAIAGTSKQASQQQATTTGGTGSGVTGAQAGLNVREQGGQLVWYFIERISIKPGVYRLNKPWECDGNQCQPVGYGLLARIGLPTVVDVDFKPAATIK
jgi:hypothetical protein